MRKPLKYIFVAVIIIISAYYSLATWALANSDMEELIVYCLHPEDNRFPPGYAQFYMLNFRGDKEDLELLESRSGLGFVLNAPDGSKKQRLKYSRFLLENGIDVDSVGHDGLTALHGAILFNQPEDVSFLLSNGATPSTQVSYNRIYGEQEETEFFGMTAIELAINLSKKDGKDRSKIIGMLTQ